MAETCMCDEAMCYDVNFEANWVKNEKIICRPFMVADFSELSCSDLQFKSDIMLFNLFFSFSNKKVFLMILSICLETVRLVINTF